jgi:hypothetical protein
MTMRGIAVRLMCAAAAVGGAFAADVEIVGDAPIHYGKSQGGYAVTVSGETAVLLKTSNGRTPPARRAEIVVERLRGLQRRRVPISGFRVCASGSSYWVYYKSERIVAATPAEAKAQHTSLKGLAQHWNAALRRLLALPPLGAKPKELLVPFGETRTLRVIGYDVGDVVIEGDGPNAPAVRVERPAGANAATGSGPAPLDQSEPGGITVRSAPDRQVIVQGYQVGDYRIAIRSRNRRISVPIAVRKWAGRVIGAQVAEVTGAPAGHRSVLQSVWSAVQRSVEVEPGARLDLTESIAAPNKLVGGATAYGSAPIEIAGPNYITRKETLEIPIRHRVVDRPAITRLLYSNNPERFKQFGTLYHGLIPAGASARLFIHHQNGLSRTARVSVYLLNRGDEEAEAHVLCGMANGAGDVIGVARQASSEYLTSRRVFSGAVVWAPAGRADRLASFVLSRDATCTAIFEVAPLGGVELEIAVVAELPDVAAGSALDHYGSKPPDGPAFGDAARTIKESYIIGERWVFISLGRSEAKEERTGKLLYGDYGVLYDIECTVTNPLSEPRRVQIRLDPSAGPAAGAFLINGELLTAPRVSPPNEAAIATITLAPGESRRLSIQTMPLAGAHYPARLVIGSR